MAEKAPNSDAVPPARSEVAGMVPVFAETASVAKRTVETDRTIIDKTVSERDEIVEALLARQNVRVERVSVGRIVSEAPPSRQEGDTWIVPILEEQLVVEKRLVLKEELHIRIETHQETVQKKVRLRTEHAAIKVEKPQSTTQQHNHKTRRAT